MEAVRSTSSARPVHGRCTSSARPVHGRCTSGAPAVHQRRKKTRLRSRNRWQQVKQTLQPRSGPYRSVDTRALASGCRRVARARGGDRERGRARADRGLAEVHRGRHGRFRLAREPIPLAPVRGAVGLRPRRESGGVADGGLVGESGRRPDAMAHARELGTMPEPPGGPALRRLCVGTRLRASDGTLSFAGLRSNIAPARRALACRGPWKSKDDRRAEVRNQDPERSRALDANPVAYEDVAIARSVGDPHEALVAIRASAACAK
jgi:hypothetical protein